MDYQHNLYIYLIIITQLPEGLGKAHTNLKISVCFTAWRFDYRWVEKKHRLKFVAKIRGVYNSRKKYQQLRMTFSAGKSQMPDFYTPQRLLGYF